MKTAFPIIFMSALLLFSCSADNKKPSRDAAVKDYTVLTLSPKTVYVHKSFPATIEGQQVIEIRPMISGYIQDILVKEGDQVRKGQLLFRISNPQYQQAVITAKASINSAEAEVNSARIEVEKVKPLVDKQIVSEYRLKSAELSLKAKEALLEQAIASHANAEANLNYTYIRSPQDGVIGIIPYKVGALVSSNSAESLTTLSDINMVHAYFSWNEKQLLDFISNSQGNTVEEKIKSMPEATLVLANSITYPVKGKIEMASGLISSETGSATLKAVFSNEKGLIRSGSSAVISIPEMKENVFVIPQGATYELQDKRFVFKIGGDNTVTAVSIDTEPTDDGKFFLTTNGLKTGDRVVIEGVASLRDGQTIIPKDTSAVSFYGKLL